jgi:hypothetical protein
LWQSDVNIAEPAKERCVWLRLSLSFKNYVNSGPDAAAYVHGARRPRHHGYGVRVAHALGHRTDARPHDSDRKGLERAGGKTSFDGARGPDPQPAGVAGYFRFKAAGWLAPLLRHLDRLAEIESRLFVVQFGGAAGTLAALGDKGLAVMQALAKLN